MSELEAAKERLEFAEKQKSEELSSLQKDKELFNMETEVCCLNLVGVNNYCVWLMQILKKSVADACKEKDDIAQQLRAVIDEKEEWRKRSEELSFKLMEIERQIEEGNFFC